MMFKVIVPVSLLLSVSATAAFAAGECAKIKNTNERLTCIEKKIDAVPAAPKTENVTIRSSSRPGQCLAWVDNGQPPRTVNCDTSDNKWTLQ
jgi:hypothetical protein